MIFCYKNATSIISIIGHDWNGFRTFLTYYTHIPGTQITSNVAKALDMLLLPLNSWPRNLAQYIIITMIICFNTFKIFNIIFFLRLHLHQIKEQRSKIMIIFNLLTPWQRKMKLLIFRNLRHNWHYSYSLLMDPSCQWIVSNHLLQYQLK